MKVYILNKKDFECEEFVKNHEKSKICHLPLWGQTVSQIMRLKNFYIVARNNSNKVCGVLPLAQIRSRIFGNRLVSQAFSNYGGFIAESELIRDLMYEYAVELAKKLDCQSIEFRNTTALPYELQTRTGKISMYLSLPNKPEELWNSFKPKVRNQVRKAEKSNLFVSDGCAGLLKDFYRVYTIRMRQLGTPAYSQKLLAGILKTFPENSRIFIVNLGPLTIAAGFTICFNGFVEIPWAATLVEYNKLCPNNLLYWSIIKHYCLAGAKCFDFGRCSVESNTYRFKKQWGAEQIDLHYQYWVHPDCQFSILSPDNSKYKRMVQIWKKLPLRITRMLGPYISRNLP